MVDGFEFDNRRVGDAGSDPGEGDNFELAVELDESLLNFPATGVDGIMPNNVQFQNRMGPKKAFSLMKFKKQIRKDTSLLFDERPVASQLPKGAFDFFQVEDVTDCRNLFKHVASAQEDSADAEESKGFFRGITRLFSGQEEQPSDAANPNLPKITAMCVVNPLRPSQGSS